MSAPRWRTGVFSHTGRRAVNQDAIVATSLPGDRDLVAVADGMGGHAAGEVASSRSLEILVRELVAGRDLSAAVRAANEAVFTASRREPAYAGMGTTLVALLRTGDRYQIANVGDSRAYRVADRRIDQITADHSFIAEAARSGRLTRQEAARSPWRNAVTRAIGIGPAVEVDLFGPYAIDGDPHAILLCTDGVYKALDDATILRATLQAEDPAAAARHLSLSALHGGSDDNITAAIVEFGRLLGRPVRPGCGIRTADRDSKVKTQAVSAHGISFDRPPTPKPAMIIAVPPESRPDQVDRNDFDRAASRWRGPIPVGENALFLLLTTALLVWLVLSIASL